MTFIQKIRHYYIVPILGRLLIKANQYCNVIYFHDIVDGEGESFMRTNISVFEKFMNYIAVNKYETLTFDDFEDVNKIKFKKKRVLIAFDDGWVSNYRILNYMKDHGLKYNVFLTIGEIGHNQDYLTWSMVKEMYDTGFVGFGAHTYTHPDMSDISKVDPIIEVNKANTIFKEELGFTPKDFCYPFGFYSEDSNKWLVNNTPYLRIYTSAWIPSYNIKNVVIFGRNAISNDYPMHYFKSKLNGLCNTYSIIRNKLKL